MDNIFPIFERIDLALSSGKSITLAIDGNSGAGKSTLGTMLSQTYDANLFRMDDFFLRPEQRTKTRLQEVGGNVDYERFRTEVLDNIRHGNKFSYRIYDCTIGEYTDEIFVSPKTINIVEGVYSMHPYLREAYDFTIFMTIDPQLQVERIRQRNGEVMLNRFLKEWIPLENKYFSQLNIPQLADIKIRPNQGL